MLELMSTENYEFNITLVSKEGDEEIDIPTCINYTTAKRLVDHIKSSPKGQRVARMQVEITNEIGDVLPLQIDDIFFDSLDLAILGVPINIYPDTTPKGK